MIFIWNLQNFVQKICQLLPLIIYLIFWIFVRKIYIEITKNKDMVELIPPLVQGDTGIAKKIISDENPQALGSIFFIPFWTFCRGARLQYRLARLGPVPHFDICIGSGHPSSCCTARSTAFCIGRGHCFFHRCRIHHQ